MPKENNLVLISNGKQQDFIRDQGLTIANRSKLLQYGALENLPPTNLPTIVVTLMGA